ncbi:H-NS histone family protein [Sulfitobacter sp. S0837]|uniref:H-NS histone family protein n=1 Tax=Sulfitobacter maritimus TaxID=2741719 RepID=UPI001582CE32|nr:H-NS histone family protein [Sulfitobacter maritimus]NUH63724.1 H-NS histone family protein [Sulfitobacter maritimus]NUH63802.1 H-NS histone family protein [Sulfitobacter maritimus]NUH65571.1 H-NS histone family protein [Sulfitobacter maritimus]
MFAKDELKTMSRKELEKLLKDVKKALAAATARDHREAKKAAARAVAEYGFSLDDISEAEGAKPKQKKKTARKPSKPVFANPENTRQTWTGKGRQPNWYRDQIARGTERDAMRIAR